MFVGVHGVLLVLPCSKLLRLAFSAVSAFALGLDGSITLYGHKPHEQENADDQSDPGRASLRSWRNMHADTDARRATWCASFFGRLNENSNVPCLRACLSACLHRAGPGR